VKVAIRADAYAEIGTGHIMRCIALGQGIMERGGEVVFITYCSSEGLVIRLKNEGFNLHLLNAPGSLTESLRLIEKERPDWVVLDGYHFDAGSQKAVKDSGYKLMVIDDYVRLDYYHADIVLNQNYGAEGFHYNAGQDTKLLLGAKYIMLRREFLKYQGFERSIPDIAEKILITMGGADPDNNTLKVLKAVNLIEIPLNAKVVIGAANPHYETMEKEAAESRHKVELLQGVENIVPLMAWADAAVSAGGSTVWELAFMGLPSLLSVVADNQEGAVNSLNRDEMFVSIGWLKNKTSEEISGRIEKIIKDREIRIIISNKCRAIHDGRGIDRLTDELTTELSRI
jgi:UDP-2,4-diacetamido-2,4,6-trideoxy-beta-L-altropyranose hydrolase